MLFLEHVLIKIQGLTLNISTSEQERSFLLWDQHLLTYKDGSSFYYCKNSGESFVNYLFFATMNSKAVMYFLNL